MHFTAVVFRAPQDAVGTAIVSSLPQLFYVAIFGVLAGWVYARTKSLVGPLLIHGIGNAGELILYWLVFA